MNTEVIAGVIAEAAHDYQIPMVDRDINCIADRIGALLAQAWREGTLASDCADCSNEPGPNPYGIKGA